MEPIVSPLTIYFLGIVDHLQCFLQALLFADLILAVCCFLFYSESDRCVIGLKYSVIAGIILGFLCAIIPNRDTLIAMLVASYVTPDNMSTANEVIKSNMQDYINMIVNGINSVK